MPTLKEAQEKVRESGSSREMLDYQDDRNLDALFSARRGELLNQLLDFLQGPKTEKDTDGIQHVIMAEAIDWYSRNTDIITLLNTDLDNDRIKAEEPDTVAFWDLLKGYKKGLAAASLNFVNGANGGAGLRDLLDGLFTYAYEGKDPESSFEDAIGPEAMKELDTLCQRVTVSFRRAGHRNQISELRQEVKKYYKPVEAKPAVEQKPAEEQKPAAEQKPAEAALSWVNEETRLRSYYIRTYQAMLPKATPAQLRQVYGWDLKTLEENAAKYLNLTRERVVRRCEDEDLPRYYRAFLISQGVPRDRAVQMPLSMLRNEAEMRFRADSQAIYNWGVTNDLTDYYRRFCAAAYQSRNLEIPQSLATATLESMEKFAQDQFQWDRSAVYSWGVIDAVTPRQPVRTQSQPQVQARPQPQAQVQKPAPVQPQPELQVQSKGPKADEIFKFNAGESIAINDLDISEDFLDREPPKKKAAKVEPEQPKPEEKPAEPPKPEEKPVEQPKVEEKPAEQPKPEEKPAEQPEPEDPFAGRPEPEDPFAGRPESADPKVDPFKHMYDPAKDPFSDEYQKAQAAEEAASRNPFEGDPLKNPFSDEYQQAEAARKAANKNVFEGDLAKNPFTDEYQEPQAAGKTAAVDPFGDTSYDPFSDEYQKAQAAEQAKAEEPKAPAEEPQPQPVAPVEEQQPQPVAPAEAAKPVEETTSLFARRDAAEVVSPKPSEDSTIVRPYPSAANETFRKGPVSAEAVNPTIDTLGPSDLHEDVEAPAEAPKVPVEEPQPEVPVIEETVEEAVPSENLVIEETVEEVPLSDIPNSEETVEEVQQTITLGPSDLHEDVEAPAEAPKVPVEEPQPEVPVIEEKVEVAPSEDLVNEGKVEEVAPSDIPASEETVEKVQQTITLGPSNLHEDVEAPAEAPKVPVEEPQPEVPAIEEKVEEPQPVDQSEPAEKEKTDDVLAAAEEIRPQAEKQPEPAEIHEEPQAADAEPAAQRVSRAKAGPDDLQEAAEPIDVNAYVTEFKALRNDLRSTLSVFSSDSDAFKNTLNYLDVLVGIDGYDESLLGRALERLNEKVKAYQKHARQDDPRPGNERRATRLGIMDKLEELADNFSKGVADPRKEAIGKATDNMVNALSTDLKDKNVNEAKLKNKFVTLDGYRKAMSSLSTYQLEKIAESPELARKTLQTVIAKNRKELEKSLNVPARNSDGPNLLH